MIEGRLFMFRLLTLITGNCMSETDAPKIIRFYQYLKASGLSEEELISLYQNKWLTVYQDLPAHCWADSLLKPYTYYYHTALHNSSAPVTFNPRTGQLTENICYQEMKIKLTPEQVIARMYQQLNTLEAFQHPKRDIEGLHYLLKKHERIYLNRLTLETIDVVLVMLDEAQQLESRNRLNFLELCNMLLTPTLARIEEKHLIPQTYFTLRTGEKILCRGK